MKKLSLTFALILFTFLTILEPLHAQWEFWSEAVSITDSVSDNKNATMRFLNFIEDDNYIFWEKSTDTISTAIYYRNFYSADEPDIFLSEETVHYTRPQLMDTWRGPNGDSVFYVFYQSDEEGINNIYYRVYNADGFTDPQLLTTSSNEKTNLQCNNGGRIVWLEQNKIIHTKLNQNSLLFEEPFVIDSANCSFPSITQSDSEWSGYQGVVAWIKEENDSSKIMLRRYFQNDGWQESEIVFVGNECRNLSFSSGMDQSNVLIWDNKNGTNWQIIYYDTDEYELYTSAFEQQEPFQPNFYTITLFVKSNYIESGYSNFVYQHNDSIDIFSSDLNFNPPIEYYQNISKSDNQVNKPKIFSGKFESPCNYFFNNIWEEQVNDHWQLKYAETYVCLSDVAEKNEVDNFQLKTSPNPFTEEIAISFLLNKPADVTLSIYNSSGQKMKTLVSGNLSAGQHYYKWNGEMAKASLYFVSLQINSTQVTKKIILTK